jgi:hypothetical protein
MSDEFKQFSSAILVWHLDFTFWSCHRHVQYLHVKLRDLVNQGLKVLEFDWAHQNADAILMWLKISLAALVVYFSVYDAIEGD